MDGTVLGMAIASISGFGNGFTANGTDTPISGESFGEVLSNISAKNPADVVNSQPVKSMLSEMYGVQTEGESIENASLFEVLKAIGGMQLDDKARETISKLFEELNSEDFDPEEIVLKLLRGEENISDEENLPEEWAGMSLDDSKKLLKIIDLMLYAASDKKPYGEKGVESIFDLLFGNDDEDMSETAADSGIISESYFWQAMVSSVTNKYTESNVDTGNSNIDITKGINNVSIEVSTAVTEENLTAISETGEVNIPKTAEENIPETAEKISPENDMIAIPAGNDEPPAEMPRTEFIDRLTKLSEALKAEISEKTGEITQTSISREDGISQAERDRLNVFAVKKESVSFAGSEIEALTGVRTAAPDITEIAESEKFSNISRQIERVMRVEMTAASAEKTDSVRELNIKLNPEELGEINVKLTTDGEKLTVAFTAENSSTAKLLSDNIRSLAAAVNRNSDSETETVYLIQAADGSENASLNLSAGFADSFGRGEPQNNNSGSQPVYRGTEPDTDDTAEENILIQEAKLWQTV